MSHFLWWAPFRNEMELQFSMGKNQLRTCNTPYTSPIIILISENVAQVIEISRRGSLRGEKIWTRKVFF